MASEERDVRDFTAIELKGYGTLHLTQGDAEALRVEADDDVLSHITTEVRGGRLVIGFKRMFIFQLPWHKGPIDFYVSFKDLQALKLSGTGKARCGSLQSYEFDLGLSGAGDVDIEQLTALKLNVDISGAGTITIANGAVESQRTRISGAGKLRAEGLRCAEADVVVSGSGNVSLRADETLTATISGVGNIDYVGSPRVQQRVSGVGHIRQRAAA